MHKFQTRQDDIIAHYDLGNEFFALWLDPEMVYSCAFFERGDDLALAQQRKLDAHADVLDRRNAKHVLDIGCGWGGFLKRAASRLPDADLVGLTLSPSQAAFKRARGIAKAEIVIENWERHAPTIPYDGIVSVEAIEHFTTPDMSELERLSRYRHFFEACAEMSSAGAPLTLQTSAFGRIAAADRNLFFANGVFPGIDAPEPRELLTAARQAYECVRTENHRTAYVRTLNEWYRRLGEARPEIEQRWGLDLWQSFRDYLGMPAAAFKTQKLELWFFEFHRR